MKLKFIGGASTVTGSCFHMEVNGLNLLVDCGMHQEESYGRKGFAFSPKEIDHVFVTHAHLDHSGMLPALKKGGFHGTIFSTSATRDLLEPMLLDSANIQESDAEWLTKKAFREGKGPVEPAYTADDVRKVLPLFEAREYQKLYHLGKGVKYRFLDAGHLLGSSSIELWYQEGAKEKKIVFSGDIGKTGGPIIKDPCPPDSADHVVMESTYGNRAHRPFKETVDEFASVIKAAFKRGGNVYIPSFAVGRAQDILYILNSLVREGRIYRFDVYLDSPLAEAATKVYLGHPECFDEEAKRFFTTKSTGQSVRLQFVRRAEESMRLNKLRSGSIIIAGSGMCEGGRIRHHLKHNLWRPECSVIFVGFQASGTLGRRLVEGARTVNILGNEVAVRASIHTINGFSAHADQSGLIEWLSCFNTQRPNVFLAHGESAARKTLFEAIRERLNITPVLPEDNEVYDI